VAKGGVYPSYLFKHHDPVLDAIDTLRSRSGLKTKVLAEKSGVRAGTLNNWRKRKTKRPQFATVKAVVKALGGELQVTFDGRVIR
jgi:transcriptional regulator with XRE-family HTH domain